LHATSTPTKHGVAITDTITSTVANDKPTDMKSVLQQRFQDLPPAPWPQLDHRIPKAILDGEMVGFDANLPPSSFHQSNTIVTAYYEFTSKHSVEKYENWFQRILRTSEPMIIFVEPGSKWFEFVKKQRKHAPTIVAQLPFEELVMSTTFTEDFWNFMFSIDTEATTHRGTGVYKIWNEKLVSLEKENYSYNIEYLFPTSMTHSTCISDCISSSGSDLYACGNYAESIQYTRVCMDGCWVL
jgi:hypothetical protein